METYHKYLHFQKDSPSGNLRRRRRADSGRYTNQIEYELPPTPGTPIPMRSTRSAVKRLYNSPLEEALDMCGKQPKMSKLSQGSPNYSNDPLGLMSPGPFMMDDSPEKEKRSKRNLQMVNEMDMIDKKKINLAMLADPGNVSPLNFGFPNPAPESPLTFNLNGLDLDPLSEPFSHNDDDNESLNTPQVSPRHSPLLSPVTPNIESPYTPISEGAAEIRSSGWPVDDPAAGGATPSRARRGTKRALSPIPMRNMSRSVVEDDIQESSRRYMRDGGIVELKLKNFIKHKNKHWIWGPHMNVITGENGSGKTAVQTAIMLCLGAKASITGRGDVLKKFIHHDASKAVIELSITNYNGTHSKRKYGEIMTFQRTITKSGTSTKLRVKDGNWTSVKAKDWNLLLRPLQIHLNNPVQILTQKTATAFLQNQEPSALFKGFKDVTLITPSEEFLKHTQINIKESEIILKSKEIEQKEYVGKAKELDEQYNKILEMESYKVKCSDLQREFYWSVVIENEGLQAEFNEKIADVDKEIEKVKEDRKLAEETREKVVSAHKSLQSGRSELEKALQQLEGQQEDAHNALREVSKEDKAVQGKIKLINDYKNKLRHELSELESKLRDSIADQATDDERMKQEIERQIREYQETIESSSAELAELKDKKVELESQQDACKRVEDECKAQLKALQAQLRDKERETKRIKQAQSTKYDRFGHDMKVLVNRIEQGSWVGQTPVGPLGAWFTVNEEEYAPMIEETLGRTLRSFATNHPDDVKTLRQLIKDVYGQKKHGVPGIISVTSSNRSGKWWSKGKAVIAGYPTLLDVLDIKHPKVTEALIEKEQIEKVVLFKTEAEACSILKDIRKVPKTCVYGISKDCFKLTPAPNYKVQPLNLRTKTAFVQTTQFDNVAELERETRRLEAEITVMTRKWEDAQRNTKGFRGLIANCDEDIRKKSRDVNRAKSLLRTCEHELSLRQVPDAASHNELIEDRREMIQSTLAEQEAELQAEQQKKDANDLVLRDRKADHERCAATIQKIRNKIKASMDEVGVFRKQCDDAEKTIRKSDGLLKALKDKKKELQSKLNLLNKALKQKTKEAQKKGDRVETTRNPSEIKSDFEGRKAFYEQNLSKIKAKDEVRRGRLRWEKLSNTMGDQIKFVHSLFSLVIHLVKLQAAHLSNKQVEYLLSFQNYFKVLIQRRGYGGQAIFSVEEEKLFYYISVDRESELRAQSHIKYNAAGKPIVDWRTLRDYIMSLSGGEKSYSNLAYITAVRQIMPSPFFMMDEFDVFMDAGNRKASADILVEQAHNQSDAQFFVFTPDDLDIPKDPYVKFFKLYKIDR